MKRDSFVTYRSFYEAVKNLDYETIGKVFVAINEYALDHNEVECDGIIKTIFTLIKPQLEASFQKAISGSKGGRVNKSKSSEELEDKEERNTSTLEANTKQNGSKQEANTKQTESKTEANEKQNGSKQQANEKQSGSNANANVNANVDIKEKNIKKEKNEISPSLKLIVDKYTSNEKMKESLKSFVKSREKLRRPLTDDALDLALEKLNKLASDDETKIRVIKQTIESGYLTFYPLKEENKQSKEPKYDDSKNVEATPEEREAFERMRGKTRHVFKEPTYDASKNIEATPEQIEAFERMRRGE